MRPRGEKKANRLPLPSLKFRLYINSSSFFNVNHWFLCPSYFFADLLSLRVSIDTLSQSSGWEGKYIIVVLRFQKKNLSSFNFISRITTRLLTSRCPISRFLYIRNNYFLEKNKVNIFSITVKMGRETGGWYIFKSLASVEDRFFVEYCCIIWLHLLKKYFTYSTYQVSDNAVAMQRRQDDRLLHRNTLTCTPL